MTEKTTDKRTTVKLLFGCALLCFGLSHGITGLLANLGWYDLIGNGFQAWYMDPAYQSLCWFANGIGLTILFPMWLSVIRRKPPSRASSAAPAQEPRGGDG